MPARKQYLGGRFGFFCFSARGGGKGSRGAGGRWGIGFFLKNPGEGGPPGREGPKGREGVCSELGNFGGGAKYFFSGPKCPPRYHLSFWRFPPCFRVIFVQFKTHACDEANCGLVRFSLAFRLTGLAIDPALRIF